MKNFLFLVIIIATVTACKKTNNQGYIVLSGTLENLNKNEIFLRGYDFTKIIKVNQDGSFSDTLKNNKGYYSLITDGKGIPFYLSKNSNLMISGDLKDFKKITFSGSNELMNRYLLKKANLTNAYEQEKYSNFHLPEKEFLDYLEKQKQEFEELIKTSNISKYFIRKEFKSSKYKQLADLELYKRLNRSFGKSINFGSSDIFHSDIEDMDFNHEEDYMTFEQYRYFLRLMYDNLADKKVEIGDSFDKAMLYIDLVNENTVNTIIANDLYYNSAKRGIHETYDIHDYYRKFMAYSTNEIHKNEITEIYNVIKITAKGEPSPKFVNYENYKGGTSSLDDFKGKYVYIDIWATWCAPCVKEIPYLKLIEEKYHDKKIYFVGISVDKKKDYKKWRKMIDEKSLDGIQLLAANGQKAHFFEDYQIKGIPRFILLDPDGIIVMPNAPRPSEDKLVKIFDDLNM